MGSLADLAEAHGVLPRWTDHRGGTVEVADDVLVAILAALGVDAADPEAALRAAVDERWRRALPPVVVAPQGAGATVWAHCRDGAPLDVEVVTDAGERRPLVQLDRWVQPRDVDGVMTGEATFAVPDDLPVGYHELRSVTEGREGRARLIVPPARLPEPPRCWGWAVQLYATPSARSWAHGDLADLRGLVTHAGRDHGAGFVLVNPLGAPALTAPVEDSPYYPSSRRFASPLYLPVEEVAEAAGVGARTLARVRGLRLSGLVEGQLDRDAVWTAKRAALELVWDEVRFDPATRERIAAFRAREGAPLERFALWCALAEVHGGDWRRWPEELRHPDAPAVAGQAARLVGRVAFHCWLQLLADERLEAAARAATDAGMALGVMHDLPVGVSPAGADAWSLQDVLVLGATVGAPPDSFNQLGQDWAQPPWHPGRLAESGYEPLAELVRGLLRHAAALRIDHVLGFFRSWWVPEGRPAGDGAYVRASSEALLAVLLVEAHRAGAVLVGEDLGVVPPEAAGALADRGILGTSMLLWTYGEDGMPLAPQRSRPASLGQVVTHDLPTVAGWLRGVHVDLRDRLGQLNRPVEEERADWERDRAWWLDRARERGLDTGDVAAQVRAMHVLLADAPCRLLAAQLVDAVGDVAVQNLPGTRDEHPNWRQPLADGEGRRVLLDDALAGPGAAGLARALGYGSAP